MDLHFNQKTNQVDFPQLGQPRSWPALLLVAAMLVCLNSSCRKSAQPENEASKTTNAKSENTTAPNDPLAIHRRAIVVDMHADTTQRLVDEKVDLAQRVPDGHLDAVRAQEGGLDAQFFS